MSNKVSKIKNNVENEKRLKEYTLYGSLIGSVIVSIGKLVGKSESDMISDFARFSKDEELYKCGNIKEVCEYIINDYKMPDDYKKYIVLCYDEENRYTPLVTVVDDEGYVQPLDRDGNYLGVLAKDDFEMEYVFEPDSEEQD